MTKAKAAKQPDSETLDRLQALIELAKTSRLSPAQEDEAAQSVRTVLAAGRTGIADAINAMLVLPWNVAVSAVSAVWPDLKPMARKQFLTALAEQKSDSAKRLRLSLARGLFPQDAETATRLTAETCADMRAEGSLSSKDRQIFSNVLIGKGKPWLQHFPIAEWKPEDAQLLITCAVDACFGGPCAPFTQITLLRWIVENNRELPEESVETILKAIKRWTPRFRKQLKNEVPNLPPAIADALAAPVVQPSPSVAPTPEAPTAEEVPQAAPEQALPLFEPEKMQPPARPPSSHSSPPQRRPKDGGRAEPYPPYRPMRAGGTAEGSFDLNQALLQIEAHVTGLRRELHEAQATLRRRDKSGPAPRAQRRSEISAASPGEIEELRRHNAQLEETIAELRHRIEDLVSHHEDQAVAIGAHEGGEAAVETEVEQFKRLLGIKLQDTFAEFEALRAESADDVIRKHFGEMLAGVFDVLARQGVPLSGETDKS